jgi:hypothetical protein
VQISEHVLHARLQDGLGLVIKGREVLRGCVCAEAVENRADLHVLCAVHAGVRVRVGGDEEEDGECVSGACVRGVCVI